MNKIGKIIDELTEWTWSNKIRWELESDDHAICKDFPSVEFSMFLDTEFLCFKNKSDSEKRLYCVKSSTYVTPRADLCEAIRFQLSEPEEKDILDICLGDIADFKNRS